MIYFKRYAGSNQFKFFKSPRRIGKLLPFFGFAKKNNKKHNMKNGTGLSRENKIEWINRRGPQSPWLHGLWSPQELRNRWARVPGEIYQRRYIAQITMKFTFLKYDMKSVFFIFKPKNQNIWFEKFEKLRENSHIFQISRKMKEIRLWDIKYSKISYVARKNDLFQKVCWFKPVQIL